MPSLYIYWTKKKTKNKQNTHKKKSSYSIISHLGHAYRGQWPGRVKWPVSSRAWMCAQRADCLLTYKNKVSLSLSYSFDSLSYTCYVFWVSARFLSADDRITSWPIIIFSRRERVEKDSVAMNTTWPDWKTKKGDTVEPRIQSSNRNKNTQPGKNEEKAHSQIDNKISVWLFYPVEKDSSPGFLFFFSWGHFVDSHVSNHCHTISRIMMDTWFISMYLFALEHKTLCVSFIWLPVRCLVALLPKEEVVVVLKSKAGVR